MLSAYQKSNLIEILHRLNEQEQKANDEMMHLMIQLQQLDNDKFLIQRALLQKGVLSYEKKRVCHCLPDMRHLFRLYVLRRTARRDSRSIKHPVRYTPLS